MFQATTRSSSLSSGEQSFKPSAQEESALKQQEELKQRTQEGDRAAVEQASERMRRGAELRTVQLQSQSLDGSTKQIDEMVRQGASAGQVADQVKQTTLGGLDYDLSRLTPPSFTQDERGKIREAYMRAVDTKAKAIEAEQLKHTEKLEAEKRSQAEREKREPGVALSS